MKLLALDSNSILNRAFYGIRPLTTKSGEHTNAVYGFINIMFKLIEEVKPDAIACAFDLKAPTFRHKMYDGYKAQRKGMPEELASQLPLIKELLELLGYKIISLEGYEADDVLGTLALSCEKSGNECVIATGDRDSLQLVSSSVNVLLASTKAGQALSTVYNTEEIFAKYGIKPKELIEVKALMGDASDNIPGVAGVGEKTALALVQKFHNLDSIYDNIDDSDIKKGVREKLIKDKEQAYLSRTLATIDCEVPISTAINEFVPSPRDEAKVYELLERLEMYSIIKKLNLSAEGATAKKAQPINLLTPEILKLSNLNISTDSVLYAYVHTDDNELPTALCVYYDKKLYVSDGDINAHILALLPHMKNIVTNDAKPLYKSIIQQNHKPQSVKFDLSIAGYILSPSSSDYSPLRLFSEYGGSFTFTADFSENELNALYLFSAYEVLSTLITEQNMEVLYYDIELPLTLVLANMESEGFLIDVEGLKAHGEALELEINALTDKIYEYAGEQFNINSPKQLGEILFDRLSLPTGKKTKSGYSTNADVLEKLKNKHPIINEILAYRTLAKVKSTYVDGFLKLVDESGRIHTIFKQKETRTGRISSKEPNMQNIPVRTEQNAILRKFFIAAENNTLVDADYSQIELRVLADISGDENMCEAFVLNEDIHTLTAAEVFDLPPLYITPEMRSRAKAVNFGIVYGIGAFSLSQDIGVSVAEADRYIKGYLKTYAGVKQYMDKAIADGSKNGYVSTIYGRRRYLPELSASNKIQKAFGERVAMNMPIQGSAADIIKIAMIKVYNRLKDEKLSARLILQVHDELIVECPEHEAETVRLLLEEEMQNAAKLKVPLIAEAKIGKNWLLAK